MQLSDPVQSCLRYRANKHDLCALHPHVLCFSRQVSPVQHMQDTACLTSSLGAAVSAHNPLRSTHTAQQLDQTQGSPQLQHLCTQVDSGALPPPPHRSTPTVDHLDGSATASHRSALPPSPDTQVSEPQPVLAHGSAPQPLLAHGLVPQDLGPLHGQPNFTTVVHNGLGKWGSAA
jgi:hypothetical protein